MRMTAHVCLKLWGVILSFSLLLSNMSFDLLDNDELMRSNMTPNELLANGFDWFELNRKPWGDFPRND